MGRMVVIGRTWKWPCVDLGCCDNQKNTTSIFILDTWVLIFPLIDKSPKRFSFNLETNCSWNKTFSSENVVQTNFQFVYWVTDIDKRNRRNKPICQWEKHRKTSREFNKNTKEPFQIYSSPLHLKDIMTNTLFLDYHNQMPKSYKTWMCFPSCSGFMWKTY